MRLKFYTSEIFTVQYKTFKGLCWATPSQVFKANIHDIHS